MAGTLSPRKLKKWARSLGLIEKEGKGSAKKYYNGKEKVTEIHEHKGKDIPKGTLKNIEKALLDFENRISR